MRTNSLGKTATYVRQENGNTIVRYHDTDVVAFNASNITLNTGGWWTVTTKARMNQASAQFDLGFRVYQEKRVWWVWFPGTDRERVLLPHRYGVLSIQRRVAVQP